eukprot:6796383-Pyramimonas_sp.AAC.1
MVVLMMETTRMLMMVMTMTMATMTMDDDDGDTRRAGAGMQRGRTREEDGRNDAGRCLFKTKNQHCNMAGRFWTTTHLPGAVNVRDSIASTTNEMFEVFLRHYTRGENAR